MAFRYINPGLVSLLDGDCAATQVTGSQFSKTGAAFSQTNSSTGVTLPHFAEGDDFWARFDFYILADTAVNVFCHIPRNAQGGVEIHIRRDGTIFGYYDGSSQQIAAGALTALGIKSDAINTVILHVAYGSSSEARLMVSLNGTAFYMAGRAISYSANYASKARLYSNSNGVYFSNVIFSDTEISPKEKVTMLPVRMTETNMAAGASGLYLADAAGQSLLQTPDVSTLINNFGASSAVTGIAVVGNPAYRTGTGITTLTGLSISGGSVAEHGTCNLSDDTTAAAMDGWSTENLTLSDLQNMQFGWKVGE